MKTIFTSKRTIAFAIFLVLGLLFILLDSEDILPITLRVIAILLVITGIIKLTFLDKNTLGVAEYRFDLYEGILIIILGNIIFNFYKYPNLLFVLGILYLIIPLVRIIHSKNKRNQLLVDCLKYIVVAILLTARRSTSLYSMYVLGGLFIFASALILFTLIRKIYRVNKKKENDVVM